MGVVVAQAVWEREASRWIVSATWRCDAARSRPVDVATRSIISDTPSGIENLFPCDLPSRIPTASLGEPSGEGSALLVCKFGRFRILIFSS